MDEMKSTLENAQIIVEFAKERNWSEEELAKVIDLLHSQLKDENIYLSSTALSEAIYPSSRS